MSAFSQKRPRKLMQMVVCFFLVSSVQSVNAVTLTNPPVSTTGSFTLSWSGGTWTYSEIWERGASSRLGTGSGTSGVFPISGKSNGTYYYDLKPCTAGQFGTTCSTIVGTFTAVVSIGSSGTASISAFVNQGAIQVNWTASPNATSYQILRNGSLIATSSKASYTDVSVSAGTAYTYSINVCQSTTCSAGLTAAPVTAGAIKAGAPVSETYQYDALGRLNTVTSGGAVKTDYRYDKAGNRTAVTE
ncbi:RHS repeat domain-containing protein [Roseateles sp. BYS78W]|uniref:RHS repeat domain-containing protein n=1 Tax=Pelomonas candidula TaxID=3299025 RepID=A0ABW7HFU3_9BURK